MTGPQATASSFCPRIKGLLFLMPGNFGRMLSEHFFMPHQNKRTLLSPPKRRARRSKRSLDTALLALAVGLGSPSVLLSCAPPPAPPATMVVVRPSDSLLQPQPVSESVAAVDPPPRFGKARRYLELGSADPASLPVRAALELPASWGIRQSGDRGRAIRPCQVSPSSPSELLLGTQKPGGGAAEDERLAKDLVDAQLVFSSEIEKRSAEAEGQDAVIARAEGQRGGRPFYAFRFVRASAAHKVEVACEAFLFEDERRWRHAYETACRTLEVEPADYQTGPAEVAAAPDGEPRSPAAEAAAAIALGYVNALGAREEKTAEGFLMTSGECFAAGGDPDECDAGANERRADIPLIIDRIPRAQTFGAADVYAPAALPGLIIATVKRRGDPCGPGWDVTLARGEKRYAVVSADPVPDPRLVHLARAAP